MEEPIIEEEEHETPAPVDAPETPDVTVAVTVPEPEPITVPETPAGGEPDQTRDMELGALRATLDAHLQAYGEDDAEWESRVTALETWQGEMTTRFSDELTMLRQEIAAAAERPIAEVYMPPEPEPVAEPENPDGAPLAERPLDEAAAAVIAPVKNALQIGPAPQRSLRRRHRR